MPFSADIFLTEALHKRKEQNIFRKLTSNNNLIDFCSNDYLGYALSAELKNNIQKEFNSIENNRNGSGGSRLLAGNSEYAENLEKKIAAFHQAPSGLLYNSGYDANVGLFSAIARKGHTVLYDELIHASIHDGLKMSPAVKASFKHNDLVDLEVKLKEAQGITYVAVESVYSMDGESAHLKEIAHLCQKYNANLIVDEAHATGITRNSGKGKVQELEIENQVFARVHTFGKALGSHGAIVLGSELLRNFLINYSRSFIYTTALPLKNLVAINQAYNLLNKSADDIEHLHHLIKHFKNNVIKHPNLVCLENNSPIQSIMIKGNTEVKKTALQLQQAGFDVRAIVSPTVPLGTERLRICIHAFNTKEQIELLCSTINKLLTN
jgi:8-amino-7-oxononanoate synthase